MEAVRLSVPGIACAGCITTIRMAVSRLDGVDKISGDDKARTITVEHEPSSVAVDAIQQALESIGYDSTVIT